MLSGARPRFSLIIPARNEEAYLPRLLDTVDAARSRYQAGPDAVEVIVSDNGSTDATRAIAEARGCRIATTDIRRIGTVRNAGARIARGIILCFVDADSRIHVETFNVIERALTERVVGGATGVALERWSLGIAVTYAIMVALVWIMRMDTGVVFCRRADFEAIGGYREDLPAAEDVMFLWALRKLGQATRPATHASAQGQSDRLHAEVRPLRRLALPDLDAAGATLADPA
jgi:glycosyltransferase involved in cell wall biosynthesis